MDRSTGSARQAQYFTQFSTQDTDSEPSAKSIKSTKWETPCKWTIRHVKAFYKKVRKPNSGADVKLASEIANFLTAENETPNHNEEWSSNVEKALSNVVKRTKTPRPGAFVKPTVSIPSSSPVVSQIPPPSPISPKTQVSSSVVAYEPPPYRPMTKVTAPRISVAQDRRMPPKVKNQPLSVETFFDPHHNLQAIVRTPTDPILSSPKLEPGWIPPSLRIGPPPSKLKLGPRLRRQLMTPQAFTPLARCPPSFPRPVRRRVQPRGQPFLTVPGQRLNRNRSLRRPLHDILAHESTLYIPANLSSIEVFASTAPVPEIVVTPEISSKGFWAVSSYVAGTALPSSNGYYNGTAESRGSAMYDAGFSDGKRVVFDTPMHSEIVAKLPRKWTDMEAV